jgi:hypothetical protein
LSDAATRSTEMTDTPFRLSPTGRAMLTLAATRRDHLVQPPELPIAAARSVVRSLLGHGLVEEVPAPGDDTSPIWRTDEGGAAVSLRATESGLNALNAIDSAEPRGARSEDQPTGPLGALGGPEAASDGNEPASPQGKPTAGQAAQHPLIGSESELKRRTLRDLAQALLDAWDDEAGGRAGLPEAIDRLRARLAPTAPAAGETGATRAPRENTKQAQVLAMLRRPEGATVAQIAEAMAWAPHTVRGFFAGVKKRLGIVIEAAERVRQVGLDKAGAKGSYTIYRIIAEPEA